MHLPANPVFHDLPTWLGVSPSTWVAVLAGLVWLGLLYKPAAKRGDDLWAKLAVLGTVAYAVAAAIDGMFTVSVFAAGTDINSAQQLWELPPWPMWAAVVLVGLTGLCSGGFVAIELYIDVQDGNRPDFTTIAMALNVVAAAYVGIELAAYAVPYGNSNAVWLSTADNDMLWLLEIAVAAFLIYLARAGWSRRHSSRPRRVQVDKVIDA